MYLPSHFEEIRIEVLHQLMDERPLATLVTIVAGFNVRCASNATFRALVEKMAAKNALDGCKTVG